MSDLLATDELAALTQRNEERKRRHDACEQDDYGCVTLYPCHYDQDVCAREIDLLLGHIRALERRVIPANIRRPFGQLVVHAIEQHRGELREQLLTITNDELERLLQEVPE